MGRLIDADELKKNIAKWLKTSSPDESEMVAVNDIAINVMIEIEEQPTAYDVDKVVEQLEEERDLSLKSAGKYYHKPLIRGNIPQLNPHAK